ncbi:MAG: D-alanyl-D-alanine carboxypeptidase family protein [bacterium]|nr:D-alanyl-D-alanine carboxypeptidase family protein [bacterium]
MLFHLAALIAVMFQTLVVPGIPVLPAPYLIPAVPVSDMPTQDATSVFLIDTKSGIIVGARHADNKRPIASITKLMTALVVLERNPDWNRHIIVDQKDQRKGDIARIFQGEEITIGDAWNLMLVASSNDAAALLSRAMFGSEESFVEAMNKKARAIGLHRTHFKDPTGLHPGNTSTAREVAILARLALSFPEIRDTVSQKQVVFSPKGKSRRVAYSTNQLLRWFSLPGVQLFGGKTGHIQESGYNLVLAAGGQGQEFVGVILGSGSNNGRFEEMATLLKWGFNTTQRSQSQGD